MKLQQSLQKNRAYLIAEMSANHSGKLEKALQIVHAAKKAGADCLKIQTYTAESLTINCDNDYFRIKGGLWDGRLLHELYSQAATPWEWQAGIKAECEKVGLDFLSTPFDKAAVDFLAGLGVEAYKIASFELVDIPLIEYAAAKGKPMLMSCGMGTPEEIQDAVDACRNQGNENIILLKCTSEYPAHFSDMNLATIPDMKQRFGVPVGLSDHSMGSLGAVVGVSLGAVVVEKHFCLSRQDPSADSAFSLEPEEFAVMSKEIRAAEEIKGTPIYALSANERGSMVFRRSLFAVRDIKKGDVFTDENVRSIRPGYGIKPKYLKCLLGTKARRDIPYGTPLLEEDVANE